MAIRHAHVGAVAVTITTLALGVLLTAGQMVLAASGNPGPPVGAATASIEPTTSAEPCDSPLPSAATSTDENTCAPGPATVEGTGVVPVYGIGSSFNATVNQKDGKLSILVNPSVDGAKINCKIVSFTATYATTWADGTKLNGKPTGSTEPAPTIPFTRDGKDGQFYFEYKDVKGQDGKPKPFTVKVTLTIKVECDKVGEDGKVVLGGDGKPVRAESNVFFVFTLNTITNPPLFVRN